MSDRRMYIRQQANDLAELERVERFYKDVRAGLRLRICATEREWFRPVSILQNRVMDVVGEWIEEQRKEIGVDEMEK